MAVHNEDKIYHLPFAIFSFVIWSIRTVIRNHSRYGWTTNDQQCEMKNGKWQMVNLQFAFNVRYRNDKKD